LSDALVDLRTISAPAVQNAATPGPFVDRASPFA
jgi:hypothetical protein